MAKRFILYINVGSITSDKATEYAEKLVKLFKEPTSERGSWLRPDERIAVMPVRDEPTHMQVIED